MEIPFFGNDRQYTKLKKEWMERADSVWSSGQYLAGGDVDKLEKRLAQLCDRKYAVALSSCVDGLSICLEFLKVKEALVTNFSFVASASCILNAGGKPRFVPVVAPHINPTLSAYTEKLSQKTDCVLGVSLFGSIAGLAELERFCKKHSLLLIEDAAQSFGATINGRKAGSFGIASCLSFDPTKIISGSSPAGCLVTDDFELASYAKSVRHHGKDEDDFILAGRKSLLSTLEASLIDLKLDHLEEYISRRREIASMYRLGLGSIKELLLPIESTGELSTYHKYVIQLDKRDELADFLKKKGITCRVHYGKPISHYGLFKDNGEAEDLETRALCSRVLSLPIFPELTDEEILYVIDSVKKFFL